MSTGNALMPVVFVGHGNPLNALQHNAYTEGWAALGARLPRPKAVLAISAHWYVPETAVTAMAAPPTIHDFGGFPRELYQVSYPAPGDPTLAGRGAVGPVDGAPRPAMGARPRYLGGSLSHLPRCRYPGGPVEHR